MPTEFLFDSTSGAVTAGTELTGTMISHVKLTAENIVGIEVKGYFSYGIGIDLLPLVPMKFQSSPLLQDYIKQLNIITGQTLSKIKDLDKLVDPYRAPETYLQHLGALIGIELEEDATITTLGTKRMQLTSAIDWYKLKGTYESLRYVAATCNVTANIFDLYTTNYSTFVRQPWFVGGEDENPAGLSASYYKSPHFVFEIVLDKVYNEGSSTDEYLFNSNVGDLAYNLLEKTRPINTVPHYSIALNAVTIEDGIVYETAANVKTITTANWNYVWKYFDENPAWKMDDGATHYDSSASAFLTSITKWQLGNGNKGVSPDTSGFILDSVVVSGNITTTTLYSDRVEFEFILPDVAPDYLGLSELGLFLGDNTTMVAAATFPDVDKTSDWELAVKVVVYKV